MIARFPDNDEPPASEGELERRHKFVDALLALQAAKSPSSGPFPSTEEMIREDRER